MLFLRVEPYLSGAFVNVDDFDDPIDIYLFATNGRYSAGLRIHGYPNTELRGFGAELAEL